MLDVSARQTCPEGYGRFAAIRDNEDAAEWHSDGRLGLRKTFGSGVELNVCTLSRAG